MNHLREMLKGHLEHHVSMLATVDDESEEVAMEQTRAACELTRVGIASVSAHTMITIAEQLERIAEQLEKHLQIMTDLRDKRIAELEEVVRPFADAYQAWLRAGSTCDHGRVFLPVDAESCKAAADALAVGPVVTMVYVTEDEPS